MHNMFLTFFFLIFCTIVNTAVCLEAADNSKNSNSANTSEKNEYFFIRVEPSTNKLDVGDEFNITVTYSWPATWANPHEAFPSDAYTDAGWYLESLPPVQKISNALFEQRIWVLSLIAHRSSTLALPKLTLLVQDEHGQIQEEHSEEQFLHVGIESNTQAELAALSPAWQAYHEENKEHSTLMRNTLVITIISLTAFIIYYYARKRNPSIPLSEQFTQRLAAIDPALAQKDFIGDIAATLRWYFGKQYSFDGEACTSQELLKILKDKIPHELWKDTQNFCQNCDAALWQDSQSNSAENNDNRDIKRQELRENAKQIVGEHLRILEEELKQAAEK